MGLKIALYNSNLFSNDNLQFAAKQPVYFDQLNSKLFSLGEYALSPIQSTIEM